MLAERVMRVVSFSVLFTFISATRSLPCGIQVLLGGEWNPPGPANLVDRGEWLGPGKGGFNTFPIPLVSAVLPVLIVTVKIGYRACDIHGLRVQLLVTAVAS